ncbi:MAG: trypsin-like serine protease [Polyangiaceae bacterium]|jgi:hypothetical protein|nr:trypsin-like serine protease [Polyangiaceae bacterium]
MKPQHRFFLLGPLLLGAASACAPTVADVADAESGESRETISFGVPVTPGSSIARSTVMFLSAATEGKHGCSASLIDASHALTAAHCTNSAQGVTDLILLFATVYAPDAPTRPVTGMVTPGGFIGAPDIAVVEFAGGLPAGFAPVSLASALPLPADTQLVHAGFGQTTSANNDRGVLHAGLGRLQELLPSPPRYLAIGDSSICSGDSGGPDYVRVGSSRRLIQVGVHVSGGCDTNPFSVSTDVRAYLAWIRSVGATPQVD